MVGILYFSLFHLITIVAPQLGKSTMAASMMGYMASLVAPSKLFIYDIIVVKNFMIFAGIKRITTTTTTAVKYSNFMGFQSYQDTYIQN